MLLLLATDASSSLVGYIDKTKKIHNQGTVSGHQVCRNFIGLPFLPLLVIPPLPCPASSCPRRVLWHLLHISGTGLAPPFESRH